ncbi:UNVERIFIED_CONTAM: hypothetical protein Sradi_1862500 [Sesamum radiatum]|uniref:Uncharacterized protein n=1 Tax=Sesamum radiatum TaxID=300843 RepID=A0AAW2TWA8_SESRA
MRADSTYLAPLLPEEVSYKVLFRRGSAKGSEGMEDPTTATPSTRARDALATTWRA